MIVCVSFDAFDCLCCLVEGGIPANPIDRLLFFLPSDYHPVDAETLNIIQRYYGVWLMSVFDEANAVGLLQEAASRPHKTTIGRLRDNNGLIVNGPFNQTASDAVILHYAFDANTFAPRVIKFGDKVNVDYEIFRRLELTEEDSVASNIVPILFAVEDSGGKRGIVMPIYTASLHQVSTPAAESLSLVRGVCQIRDALDVLHQRGIFTTMSNRKIFCLIVTGTGTYATSDLVSAKVFVQEAKCGTARPISRGTEPAVDVAVILTACYW